MTITILSFDEADYDPTDIHHILTAQRQHGTAEPAGLWLGQWQAGKVDMVKHQVPPLEFEDTAEGQVVIAMKQGVINAVMAEIQERFGNKDHGLEALQLYQSAVEALDEIERLQDGLIDGKVGRDSDEA